jgi:hypothetical protein
MSVQSLVGDVKDLLRLFLVGLQESGNLGYEMLGFFLQEEEDEQKEEKEGSVFPPSMAHRKRKLDFPD